MTAYEALLEAIIHAVEGSAPEGIDPRFYDAKFWLGEIIDETLSVWGAENTRLAWHDACAAADVNPEGDLGAWMRP
jgi:hypothetical protein